MMVNLSPDDVVCATSEQVSCELAGEVVVLSLRTGEYYGLNEVAAAAWGHLQAPVAVSALRDALLEEFSGVTAERCAEELDALLRELARMGLVDVRAAAAAGAA